MHGLALLRKGQNPAAMVSRIRVEVRGETMEAAESVAFQVLNQCQQVGILEGVMGMEGDWSDHFFHRPEVTAKGGDAIEEWNELGLSYAGRLAFTFRPGVTAGGLKQYGYEVKPLEGDDAPGEWAVDGEPHHGYIVLQRHHEVTRESSWEASELRDHPSETAESIIEDIKTIRTVLAVEARSDASGVSVLVYTSFADGSTSASGETMREAAAKARVAVVKAVEAFEAKAAQSR